MNEVDKRIASLSPKQLAFLNRRLRDAPAAKAIQGIPVRANKSEPPPLSSSQQRLWFLDQMHPGNPAYNLSLMLPFGGIPNQNILERALNEIIRRHETLRTSFRELNGRPVQQIAKELSIKLPVLDLQGLPEQTRQAKFAAHVNELCLTPFDLSRLPLIRAQLFHLTSATYNLVLVMHHIISDGWSLGVMTRELTALYEAYVQGRPSPLPELPIQCADFAVWERDQLDGAQAAAHLDYWKRQLDGAPELLNLPTDRQLPGVRSFEGAAIQVPLKASTVVGIRNLARAEGVTLFVALLAAFNALLCRYTGQGEVIVGTPVANRDRQELEPLIGFFVNTLVLRAKFLPRHSFRELLKHMQDVTLDAFAHQNFPFERLVAELTTERDPRRNPLFQVLFALQSEEGRHGTAAQTNVAGQPADSPVVIAAATPQAPPVKTLVKLDLALTAIEVGAEIFLVWEYRSDIFEDETISRMSRHFMTLLESALAHPDRPLSTLDLLSDAEQHEQIVMWNESASPARERRCLHELFEAQVEKTPEAVALVSGDERITFRELNRRANNLAYKLRARGVGAERRVGICMERSPQMVVSVLAVLKAGAAYVPLDPAYPAARLSHMANDAGLALVLSQDKFLPLLAGGEDVLPLDVPVIDAETQSPAIAGDKSLDKNLERTAAPENLAYVIYTSGSTGRPKGVMISHAAIVNHMRWMLEAWPLGERDAVLQRTPFSFDASVWELFAPLMSGARLVLPPPGSVDHNSLIEEINRHEVTVLQLVPSLLSSLLEDSNLAACSTLKRVYCGGEALNAELESRFLNLSKAELYNLYGPTEAAIDAAWLKCEGKYERPTVPVGRPIANAQTYVLDAELRPVPIGVAGDLYIGGDGLARGYLNRPAQTAEVFIPSPFGANGGERLYRTGDTACYLPDGTIEFLGRVDQQVKIRGFRIELAEVEAALLSHPDLEHGVVVGEEDGFGSRRLAAYVVPRAGASPNVEAVRGYLSRLLPPFMIPASFVVLDELPRLPNGKFDRAALAKAVADGGGGGRSLLREEFQEPQNEVEEKLAGIWSQVLEIERIGTRDNFFALGGHSLLASRIVSRIRDGFGVELPLRQIFESPTVSSLSLSILALLDERRKSRPNLRDLSEDERQSLIENLDTYTEEQIDALFSEYGEVTK